LNRVGVNGLFYDQQAPGHEFNFDVRRFGMTITYFGHTNTGERLWLISDTHAGDIDFSQPIELRFHEVTDGVFGIPVMPESYWGNITITLSGCDSGRAEFDGLDGLFEMDLVRLTGLPETSCNQR
jgi:hypothetical protein